MTGRALRLAGATRTLALVAALGVHIAAAVLMLRRAQPGEPALEVRPDGVDIILVSAPAQPEPDRQPEEQPAPAPRAAPVTQPENRPAPEPSSQPRSEASAVEGRAPAPAPEPASGAATLDVLSAPGGEGAAAVVFQQPRRHEGPLRGVVCAGAGQAMREALGCAGPQADLTAFARSGAVGDISSRFARSDQALSRRSWLMLGLQPRNGSLMAAPDPRLAASDSMRDRLPPSAPDPAFGD